MITNKIISTILTIVSFIVIPIQFITTFVLGLLVRITFGLLLIPLSIVWTILFLGPLLGLSFIYERIFIVRIFVVIIGIPLAIIGDTYIALIPSMGELESRYSKMIYCQTFPYTYRYHQFSNRKLTLKPNDILYKIFNEVGKTEPLRIYLENIIEENQT